MKKVVLLFAVTMMATVSVNAQLGNMLNKAAQKAGQKAGESAANAVMDRLGIGKAKTTQASDNSNSGSSSFGFMNAPTQDAAEVDKIPTIQELMEQMPDLPTSAQLVDYKNAEANDMTLKMMTSPVTMFRTQMATLAMQALAVGYGDMDSVRIAALATQYTGLTAEEIKAMENMTDEQQEAFMMAYYQSGRADLARQKAAENAEKYAQMIAGQVEQFEAVNDKVDEVYKSAQKQMKPIYEKFAKQLENAEGKAYSKLMAEYYGKIVDVQRNAVVQAMKVRQNEQMPVAEKIEKVNENIRKNDPTAIVPNYLQLFATAYFGEVEKLFETPTYFED